MVVKSGAKITLMTEEPNFLSARFMISEDDILSKEGIEKDLTNDGIS
jgi:hypothetical protein